MFPIVFVAWAVWRRRVGFPVDAAIVGFAVGTGFALGRERVLSRGGQLGRPGVLARARLRGRHPARRHDCHRRHPHTDGRLPASRPAHRHLPAGPGGRTRATPSTISSCCRRSWPPSYCSPSCRPSCSTPSSAASATREWVGEGLDLDVELLRLVLSDDFGHTRLGAYLQELRDRFPHPVVADMYCLMRLELELGIRVKGMLMARDAGLEVPVDDDLTSQLAEVRYLEQSIGPTGLLALTPLQVSSDRDPWHKFLLRDVRRT